MAITLSRVKIPWRKLALWVVSAMVVAVLGAVIGHYVERWITKPEVEEPYVAVIMSPESPLSSVSKEFLQGFHTKEQGKDFVLTAHGRRVAIREYDDLDNEADAERYAQKLLKEPNCVLVLGNSDSTLTAVSLDVFMEDPQKAPAMIMPIATADELLIRAKAAKYFGILRMPPPDTKQAQLIVNLAFKLSTAIIDPKKRTVAIYGDASNAVYSSNLVRLVAEKSRERGLRVLTEELIGVQHSFYSSLPAWQGTNSPAIVIYVGNTHHALLLCDQVSGLDNKPPIIFSDGCMTEETLKYMKTFPNSAYLTSPLKLQGTNQDGEERPLTYMPYGEDAFVLMEKILNGVESVSRPNIARYVKEKRSEVELPAGAAGRYKFDEDGNNTAIMFQAYQISGGKLKPYDLERGVVEK